MGEAKHPHLAEALRLRRQAHQRDIVQLRQAQLLVLLRQAGGHLRQGHSPGGIGGLQIVKPAEIDIGDDAQHQIVHLVEAVPCEGQVAPPAQVVHDSPVLFHMPLLFSCLRCQYSIVSLRRQAVCGTRLSKICCWIFICVFSESRLLSAVFYDILLL